MSDPEHKAIKTPGVEETRTKFIAAPTPSADRKGGTLAAARRAMDQHADALTELAK